MNTRERFLRIMSFKQPDRLPLVDLEGFVEETIRLWCGQGFPPGVNVDDYFGLEIRQPYRGSLEIDFGPIPSFVERTLESSEKYVTRVNRFGYTERRSKELPMRSYGYTAFPIKHRADWEAMECRYDPHDIRRLPKCWGDEFLEYLGNLDKPVGLGFVWGPGRGPKGGYGMGVKRFLSMFARDPDWVHEVFRSYADFVIELAHPVVRQIKLDYVSVEEDGIAYANGPLVSPSIYREFYLPYVKKVLGFFRSYGVRIVAEYTSGNIQPLIPLFLDAGYNLFWPLECAAGMDCVKLREIYGERLMMVGNISRGALMAGKKAVEKEFKSKVPPLVEHGGYIPAVDDMIMPDISFESYRHYIALVRDFRP